MLNLALRIWDWFTHLFFERKPMGVSIYASPDHTAVVFSYDMHAIQGDTIEIRAQNLESGDKGNRFAANSGTFVLFYPVNTYLTDYITVTGSEAGVETGECLISV